MKAHECMFILNRNPHSYASSYLRFRLIVIISFHITMVIQDQNAHQLKSLVAHRKPLSNMDAFVSKAFVNNRHNMDIQTSHFQIICRLHISRLADHVHVTYFANSAWLLSIVPSSCKCPCNGRCQNTLLRSTVKIKRSTCRIIF